MDGRSNARIRWSSTTDYNDKLFKSQTLPCQVLFLATWTSVHMSHTMHLGTHRCTNKKLRSVQTKYDGILLLAIFPRCPNSYELCVWPFRCVRRRVMVACCLRECYVTKATNITLGSVILPPYTSKIFSSVKIAHQRQSEAFWQG